MTMYKWLFFDLDDTLLDFGATERAAFKGMLKKNGISYREGAFESYAKINKALWKAVENGQLSQQDLKRLRFKQWVEHEQLALDPDELANDFVEGLSQGHFLVADSEEVIHSLSRSYRLAIITNGIAEVQKSRLAKSSIGPYFKHVYISEAIGYSKPDKRFFEWVIHDLGIENKKDILIIGDSIASDMVGGHNLGIDTCLFSVKGETSPYATFVITSLKELLLRL